MLHLPAFAVSQLRWDRIDERDVYVHVRKLLPERLKEVAGKILVEDVLACVSAHTFVCEKVEVDGVKTFHGVPP